MATRLLTRRTAPSASKTLARLLHPSSPPLDPISSASAARCIRHLRPSVASQPLDARSGANRSIPGADLARASFSSAFSGCLPPAASVHTSLGSAKIIGHSYIPPFHRYEIPQPRWFSEKAQGGPQKHQPDKVHPQLDDSTKKNDTSKMPDQLYGEGGKHSQIISFSPLETRISGLRSESSKIKWIERSQKLTYALIPALLIVSKTKLTTSLLILSVYWQIYGFFKEIFLDYVHQEVTLKWLLVYFRLLLLILAKDTFLYFNLV